jgi:serine protease Do
MTQLPSPFGRDWPFGEDLLKRFFGDRFHAVPRHKAPQPRRTRSAGSGFVFATKSGLLSDKSYVLTNNHVVEDAERIRVKLSDGREFDARVKGTDSHSDVAVLEIDTGGLQALKLGDSNRLEVGEWVVAIGNPFGLSNTLTVGVVSAKGRSSLGINDYEDFIQTDAAINPGNSGGPLVNLDGEVVGINTAIFSRSGGYMGVGFAIPINLVKAVADQLVDNGEVERGYLGIVIQDLTPELAQSFGMEQGKGILVAQVAEDSPAARAGLQQGDVILAYRGRPVTSVGSFRNQVSLTRPDSEQFLTIMREGKRQEIEVTIGRLSEETRIAQDASQTTDELGLTVQTLTPALAEQFDAQAGEGVVVTEVKPGSIAAMAGIRPGAVIMQVNRTAVRNAAEFKQAVQQSSADKRVLLLIRRGNMQHYVVLSW